MTRRSACFLLGTASARGAAPTKFPDIPRDYLEEADSIPEWWITTPEAVAKFLQANVRKGQVREIGRTAGGRPMRAVFYGRARQGAGTSTFSGSLGFGDVRAWYGPDYEKRVYMGMGAVHGAEMEGIAGLVNLVSAMETGHDLRGKAWPELSEAAAKLDRVILMPIVNVDGRTRVPFRMLKYRGTDNAAQEYFNTGGWKDGKLIGWPQCKQFIPLDFAKTQFPGGYPNDAGVNIQHDDFFGNPQPETRALFRLTATERPDLILNMHTGASFPEMLREFNETSLTPAYNELFRRTHGALALAGLRQTKNPDIEGDASRRRVGVFNLSTALNLNSGALSVLIESPSHGYSMAKRNGQVVRHTADELVDAQLICHQEAMKYLVETGGRHRWSQR